MPRPAFSFRSPCFVSPYRHGVFLRALLVALGILTGGVGALGETISPASPRERINFDAGWRFALGHAADVQQDFEYATGAFSHFAKAGFGAGASATTDIDSTVEAFARNSTLTAAGNLDLPADVAALAPLERRRRRLIEGRDHDEQRQDGGERRIPKDRRQMIGDWHQWGAAILPDLACRDET